MSEPNDTSHALYDVENMQLALRHALMARDRGDTPVASVIAKGDRMLAVGENAVASSGDVTAHAEVVALRTALAEHGASAVKGATCYTTMEPCPMCAWALVEGGIARIVMGSRHRGLQRKAYGAYDLETLFAMTKHSIAVVEGVLTAECNEMRLTWMRKMGRES